MTRLYTSSRRLNAGSHKSIIKIARTEVTRLPSNTESAGVTRKVKIAVLKKRTMHNFVMMEFCLLVSFLCTSKEQVAFITYGNPIFKTTIKTDVITAIAWST